MKPRIFIGSSSERLEIAYSIQENLDFDAETTVWTQGIFKLSQTSLDSLINSLDQFDFGIFVFHPDDITQIRNKDFETVRDNLIFELGLFIGRLGKERVFFLTPRDIESLHLPTDLLGITPGKYDHNRKDKNLNASLGPFCNQIRGEIKNFSFQNLAGIENESDEIKKVVLDKDYNWEYRFASKLLGNRLKRINKSYEEIENDFVIQQIKHINGYDFFKWFGLTTSNFRNFLILLEKCIGDLEENLTSESEQTKPIEIKNSVERIIQLCDECISWEFELLSLDPPEDLKSVKENLRGVTKDLLIIPFNQLQSELSRVEEFRDKEDNVTLEITPKMPKRVLSSNSIFEQYFTNNYSG